MLSPNLQAHNISYKPRIIRIQTDYEPNLVPTRITGTLGAKRQSSGIH